MNACRVSEECEKGIDDFLQFAHQNGKPINGAYYYHLLSKSNMSVLRKNM